MASETIFEHVFYLLEEHAPRLSYVLHAYTYDFGNTTFQQLATALRSKSNCRNIIYCIETL